MKITQIMLAKGFGGAERYFVDLALALSAEGHDVQVIHHKNFKGNNLLSGKDIYRDDHISVAGSWDVLAGFKVKKLMQEFSPDVVHAHLARASHIAGKACHKLSIPLVVKTHNYVDLKYYQYVDMFVPTTKDQEEYLLRQHIDESAIEAIPNFSSITPVENCKENKRSTTFRIVSFGRMVRKKGFHILLQAFRKLHDQGVTAKLIIGGDGPDFNILRQQCINLNLDNHVIFKGWVEDISALLDEADLFVLPSLDEPFGIAVLEAMAKGVPIISTRTIGPLEILNEETARLVEIGNDVELAEKIGEAFYDRQGSQDRAEAALARYKKDYSKDVVVPRLIDLYKKIIAKKLQ